MNNRSTPVRKPPIARATVNHPGAIIAMELEARGWSQKDLANITQRPEQAVSEIINGHKRITAETAYALSGAFDIKEEFWLNLESNYQLFLAKGNVEQSEVSRRSALFSIAPVLEMVRRGWLKLASKTTDSLEKAMREFYGAYQPEDSPYLKKMCYRSSESRVPEEYAKIAWAIQVYHLASQKSLVDFDKNTSTKLINDLLKMLVHPRQVSNVKSVLESYGIHFIILEHLPKTYIDGATFYIDKNPVIAMTMRFDRIDYFWFTLMHELAHIVLGHTEIRIDNFDQKDINDESENQADELSRSWLILDSKFREFTSNNSKFNKKIVDVFAESIERHPAIVIGRLQREGFIGYSAMRAYLPKVAHFLTLE